MRGLGLVELLSLLLVVGVPLAGAIDAAQKPKAAFRSASRGKTFWVAVQILGIFFFGLGLVAAVIYFLTVRPKVASRT